MSERLPNGHFAPGNQVGVASGNQWKPGKSANPGGVSKTRKELRAAAREHMPRAIDLAREFLDDTNLKPKERMDAARFLAQVGGLAAPPRTENDEDPRATRAAIIEALSIDEMRALARREMAMERRQLTDGAEPEH